MALVTLQTIFQDAFPACEQMHPLPPTSAEPHAPSCSVGPPRWAAMSRRAPTATAHVSGTTRVGIGRVRSARISRPSAGWRGNRRGSWRVTLIM